METYSEVPTETTEDLTFGDVMLLTGLTFAFCFFVVFIFKQIKNTFKNVHLKVGNIEVGVETKEADKKEKESKNEKDS